MSSRLRHYAVLAAVAVLLSGGSAYAGGAIARNSVGTFQVRDNSLRTQDVRNGTLARADLAVGAAPRTYTFIRRIPDGTTRILTIPGLSRFDASCSASSIGLSISFGDSDPATPEVQQHGLLASDIADNTPDGGVTITGGGGGVGFSTGGGAAPASGQFVSGDYWGRSERLLAHGTFSWGLPNVPCLVRLQVVVQELRTPIPVSRTVPGQRRRGDATCEHDGSTAAYCVLPD